MCVFYDDAVFCRDLLDHCDCFRKPTALFKMLSVVFTSRLFALSDPSSRRCFKGYVDSCRPTAMGLSDMGELKIKQVGRK